MASFHIAMKNGKRTGSSHAQYITREGKYSRGEKAEELVAKEHGNMPAWAQDNPQDYWKAADEFERVGGRSYTEFEIDLPNELTPDQREQLVKDFVKQQFGNDFTYTWAIHEKPATLEPDKQNPHAHIMFSERRNDGIERSREQYFRRANSKKPELGGVKKDPEWHRRDKPAEVRKQWAEMQNRALEREGYEIRVDHRTLADQREDALQRGDLRAAALLDRAPEKHLGPRRAADPQNHDRQNILEYRAVRRELAEMQRQLQEVEQRIAKRERAAQHIEFAPVETTVGALLAEANEHKTGLYNLIADHKAAQQKLDTDEKTLLAPHRAAAIERLIEKQFGAQRQAFNQETDRYNRDNSRYSTGEGYGFIERKTGTGQYARDGAALQERYQKLIADQQHLHSAEVTYRASLERGSDQYLVGREIAQREPSIAQQLEQISRMRDRKSVV